MFVSGCPGPASCFLQPWRRRLQPDTPSLSRKQWRVARGGAGSLRPGVHAAAGRRRRETRSRGLAGTEPGDHYWPLGGDAWKLFSLGTQPELPRYVVMSGITRIYLEWINKRWVGFQKTWWFENNRHTKNEKIQSVSQPEPMLLPCPGVKQGKLVRGSDLYLNDVLGLMLTRMSNLTNRENILQRSNPCWQVSLRLFGCLQAPESGSVLVCRYVRKSVCVSQSVLCTGFYTLSLV